MHYQTGNMREINNDMSPSKKSWDYQNDFHYAQRSKYQKSQISVTQNQKSKVHYDGDKTDRFSKNTMEVGKELHKDISFKIKSPDHEDKFGFLHVQMYISSEKSHSTFTMHFTDDKDSLFLWSCFVRESQFSQIKSKLSLRVDFHGFPEMINQLLSCCIDQDKQVRMSERDSYFFAVFQVKKNREEADFKILEANKYKQSEHFHLTFKKANDDQLKRYLSHKFDNEKSQNQRLIREMSHVTDHLNRRIEEVQTLSYKFDHTVKQKDDRIEELQKSQRQKLKSEILKIKEENHNEQVQQKRRNQMKVQQLNYKIKQITDKYGQMSEKHAEDHKKIIQLEQSQSSLSKKNKNLQKQVQNLQKINNDLKMKEIQMNQLHHNLTNQNTKLSCKIESLNQWIKEKDARLAETSQQKSTNSNQITTLQQNMRVEKRKVQKLQEKNQNLEEQLNKLKRKHDDLQHKHQKKKDKIADYIDIIKSQQQKVEEKQKDMKRVLEEISHQKREREKSQIQIKDRQVKIKDLKTLVQNQEEEIENLKKLLKNYHKQINGRKQFDSTRLPSYSPLNSTITRDFSGAIASNSESRIKYSPIVSNTSNLSSLPSDKHQKTIPEIKKYRQGNENDRNRENSKSPIVSRLSQQQDPEDNEKTREKIGPIKFRK